MTTYKVRRFYQDPNYEAEDVRGLSGLTLEEAQRHCKGPEASSRTANSPEARRRTMQKGHWFEGYTAE